MWRKLLILGMAFLLFGAVLHAKVTLLYMTAGDINMLALAQNVIGPMFSERYPEVDLRTIHTGPGDAGSRLIFEKLRAEKAAGKETWDVDVAMVHQIFLSWVKDEYGDLSELLLQYAQDLETWKYVTSPHAKYALGVPVQGYVMPMFHSQTAIAYNPKYVPEPPRSFEELVEWVKAHPGKFGYNGIKGGMSGVSFVNAWVYWKTGKYQKYAITGPFEEEEVASWEPVFKELKEFNKHVTITAGNVGTLDALNRGEIWMGPVWVDMFYTFMLTGKMDPNMRLVLPAPGMPGQPMYFVIPAKARNVEWAKKFVEFVTSPEIQGKVIVEMYNWYPGIDGTYVKGYVSPEAYERLYRDITPEELQEKGLAFPLSPYFKAVLESYEKWVIGG